MQQAVVYSPPTPEATMREPLISKREPPYIKGIYWECQCARCGSSCDWQECYNCEDGASHHDCGDDCCCCLDPLPNVRCEVCNGNGGWWRCLSDYDWCNNNPMPGREDTKRGMFEWFPDPQFSDPQAREAYEATTVGGSDA